MAAEHSDHRVEREGGDQISLVEKGLLLFGGLINPVCTHLLVVQYAGAGQWIGSPRYQTGLLKDKLSFLLSFDSLLWLYPLIVFSLVSFTTLVVDLRHSAKAAWARFGLLTGLPLGLAFHLALLSQLHLGGREVVFYHAIPIVTVLLIWGFAALMIRFTSDRKAATIAGVSILMAFLTFLATLRVIVTGDQTDWAFLAFPLAAVVYALIFYGPLIWLGCFGWMLGRLSSASPSTKQITVAGLLAWVTWLATFFAACRHAVVTSLESYSRLPMTDPGSCYVATAACQGHRRLVGRTRCHRGGLVSSQLKTLKAFELAMATLVPDFHRRLRRIYDFVGPIIAHRIGSPLAGDLAFLSLLPAQWTAWLLLRILLGSDVKRIHRLYDRDPRPSALTDDG